MRALLVIDLQNGVCNEDGRIYNYDSLIQGVNERIKAYRKTADPIIFVQHNDAELVRNTVAWELVPELDVLPTDFFVQKTHPNAFFNTELQSILENLNVQEIEICGAQTEYCVDTTIKVAHDRHYQLSMHRGLVATNDNEFMTAEETGKFFEGIWNHTFLRLFS